MSFLKANSLFFLIVFLIFSCSNNEEIPEPTEAQLLLKFKFDPNQERLDNFGNVQTLPANHAAQTPVFNQMGVHYMELSEKNDIPAYNGTLLYQSPMTNKGGAEAIDFDEALYAADGEIFFSIDLKDVNPGVYEFLRISLSYQNYSINFRAENLNLTGTIASFVGANTYIDDFIVKDQRVNIAANKRQGYWAFETDFPGVPVLEGQAPAGATTVPNPIHNSSPIPVGSCLVTGRFATPFEITGTETEDVVVLCSVSINNSFEWMDSNNNGTYEPTEGDVVVDMGVRGLIPSVE